MNRQAEQPTGTRRGLAPPAFAAPGRGARILLVEDDEDTRQLLAVAQVRRILAEMTGDLSDRSPVGPGAYARDPSVQLVLYVSSDSPASLRARRHLESTLARFEPGQVRLEVCDVAQDPARGEADHVVFTPTLVTRCAGAASWVLGDLGDGAMLMDLLHVCGLEPVR